MDVEELLGYKPTKPNTLKRKAESTNEREAETGGEARPPLPSKPRIAASAPLDDASNGGGLELSEEERLKILKMVEDEPEEDPLDDTQLRKLVLQFEKKVFKNQEMRIKFPDQPDKFMESEVELNNAIQELHVIATVPDLYPHLVELNAVPSLMGLLAHENADISVAVVDLLQELTDVDVLTESQQGADTLIDALLENQVVATLIQSLDRLDESQREEADGVHNTLGIVENMMELRPEMCVDAAKQGLMQWILKRLKAKMPFDANKLYASEILAILLQSHQENRDQLGEQGGIDILLQQLAFYKRHDPSSSEETEMMENFFDSLCSALMLPPNRERFLKGEGLQLMNLMLREKKASRSSSLKVLNYAMSGTEGTENCLKFVEILGLRSLFPLFMKTPKRGKKTGISPEQHEEHVTSIIASLLRNCSGQHRQRILTKFTENDHAKVDRLMEMHFTYWEKMQAVDNQIEAEKEQLVKDGEEVGEEAEDEFYIRRLDAGLFTLQLVDCIILEVTSSAPPSIKQRVLQLLNMRAGSINSIRTIIREFAGHLGDEKTKEFAEAEKQRLLSLANKF